MRNQPSRIARGLLLTLLLPSLVPVLGTPQAGLACGCREGRCCLLCRRSGTDGDHVSHGEHHGGPGSHGQASRSARDASSPAQHGDSSVDGGHSAHGSHSASDPSSPHSGASSAEPIGGSAPCHASDLQERADSPSAASEPVSATLSATCRAASPLLAPFPVSRFALTAPRNSGYAAPLVRYGTAPVNPRTLPDSLSTEPSTPPPRAA